jgi:REP element-mobilizing transposase RayT
VCASRRGERFGQIVDGVFAPNSHGRLISELWLETACIRSEVQLDEWVLMPDHFHALLQIETPPQKFVIDITSQPAFGHRVPKSLGSLVAGWKARVTSQINQYRAAHGWAPVHLWQRNYYDHIVRHERELPFIRKYIQNNPAHWLEDEHF